MIKVTFKELEEKGFSTSLDYCYYLVTGGEDPNQSMEVWREGMKCLINPNIGRAAEYYISDLQYKKRIGLGGGRSLTGAFK